MIEPGQARAVAPKATVLQYLISGSLASILVKVVGTGISFALAVFLARILGPEGYGAYAFALAIVTVLAIPAQVGLPELVVRETAKAQTMAAWGLMRGLWRWSNMFVGLFSLLMLISGIGVLYVIGDGLGETRRHTLAVGLALIPLIALANVRGAALRGLRKVVLGQLPEQVIRPLLLLLMTVSAFTFWNGLTPVSVIALHGLSAFLAFAVGAALLRRARPTGIRARPRPDYASRYWRRAAFPLALISGLQLINAHADILMLGIFRSDSEVGVYRVVVQVAMLVIFGLAAVNQALDPYFARLHLQGDRIRLQRLVTYSARGILLLAIPPVIVLLAFGGEILELFFGADYRSGAAALEILAFAQLVNAGMGSVGVLLKMTGHERDAVRGIAIAAMVNVLLNFALIPPLGMQGAAIGTAVTLVVWNVILRYFVRKRLHIESTVIGGKLH